MKNYIRIVLLLLLFVTNSVLAQTRPSFMQLKDSPIIDIRTYGAIGDGLTDNSAKIQSALNAASNTTGAALFIPQGDFLFNTTLIVGGNTTIRSHERGVLRCGFTDKNAIVASGVQNIDIDINLTGIGDYSTGIQRALYLNNCSDSEIAAKIINCLDIAVGLVDCDNVRVDADVKFPSDDRGYAVQLDGCSNCSVTGYADIVNFGVVVISKSLAGSLSLRNYASATANLVHDMHISHADGHFYDINASFGNVISNCMAEDSDATDFNGFDDTAYVAFQSKGTGTAKGNVFLGCSATRVGAGLGGQNTSYNSFSNFTLNDIKSKAIFLSNGTGNIIDNISVNNWGVATSSALISLSSGGHNRITNIHAVTTDNVNKINPLISVVSTGNYLDSISIIQADNSVFTYAIFVNGTYNVFGQDLTGLFLTRAPALKTHAFTEEAIQISGSPNTRLPIIGSSRFLASDTITKRLFSPPGSSIGAWVAKVTVTTVEGITGAPGYLSLGERTDTDKMISKYLLEKTTKYSIDTIYPSLASSPIDMMDYSYSLASSTVGEFEITTYGWRRP